MEKILIRALKLVVSSFENSHMTDLKRYMVEARHLINEYEKKNPAKPVQEESTNEDIACPQQDENEDFLMDDSVNTDD